MSRRFELKPWSTSSEELPVKLSADDRIARGRALAKTVDVLDQIEVEKKSATSDFTRRRKEVVKQQHELRGAVHDGVEHRQVRVALFPDWAKFEVRTVRLDDWTEVRRRAMTATERQRPLFDEKKKVQAKKEEKKDGKGADDKKKADLKVVPPQPHPEQLTKIGRFFGRCALEAAGKRVHWVEGSWPTLEQREEIEETVERTLNEAELAAAIDGYRSECCQLPEGVAPPVPVDQPTVAITPIEDVPIGDGPAATEPAKAPAPATDEAAPEKKKRKRKNDDQQQPPAAAS